MRSDAAGLADAELRLVAARQEELERQRRGPETRAIEFAGEMISIPGGVFDMGDLSGDGRSNEKPIRRVTVPAFKLGKYEVTFVQWEACVADGGCDDYQPNHSGWGRGNRPVINVSQSEIEGFIDWLNASTGGNYRLPSEAEWEYAARAGSATKYSWGNEVSRNRANCDGCGSEWDDDRTAPVGSFLANAWGLHDMHGNVQEWVQDCWNDSYVGAPNNGNAWMSGSCNQNVIRGGSFYECTRKYPLSKAGVGCWHALL